MAGEARQQAALRRLYEIAKGEIRAALALVDPGDTAAIADVIATYVPVIAERYGLAAGALAADWYEEMREAAEVAGYFRADPAPLPDMGRYESMAQWAAARHEVEALVVGGVQRVIANAHRQTVIGASLADPQATGWRRIARANACAFCRMLASRPGYVYSEASVMFKSHDNCSCMAGPEFAQNVRKIIGVPFEYSQRKSGWSAERKRRENQRVYDYPDS